MIIYLHGLNSSPLSSKAVLLAEYCAQRDIACIVPQLHHRPAQAIAQIESLLQKSPQVLVGSSMGGYYATWCCEHYAYAKAVLINPALKLADKIADYVGQTQQLYHTDESYVFTEEHLAEFRAVEVAAIVDPSKYMLMAQKGDELLDYREAVNFYAGAKQIIEEGGDHMFVGFERHLSAIVDFAGDAAN